MAGNDKTVSRVGADGIRRNGFITETGNKHAVCRVYKRQLVQQLRQRMSAVGKGILLSLNIICHFQCIILAYRLADGIGSGFIGDGDTAGTAVRNYKLRGD